MTSPPQPPHPSAPQDNNTRSSTDPHLDHLPACPVCGGPLEEIRKKWQCQRCHTICETCCEGGRG
ncbi:MAG TPA: hypothetical protein VM165_04060 [Planctomycetaceae bacterium]|nr:hypothetical protein [Planctomycetaceae bacterium]